MNYGIYILKNGIIAQEIIDNIRHEVLKLFDLTVKK